MQLLRSWLFRRESWPRTQSSMLCFPSQHVGTCCKVKVLVPRAGENAKHKSDIHRGGKAPSKELSFKFGGAGTQNRFWSKPLFLDIFGRPCLTLPLDWESIFPKSWEGVNSHSGSLGGSHINTSCLSNISTGIWQPCCHPSGSLPNPSFLLPWLKLLCFSSREMSPPNSC